MNDNMNSSTNKDIDKSTGVNSGHIGNNLLISGDKERMNSFRTNLKKHLSNEYLILSGKKDELESDATQIRVEIERRDRTLFPSNEHEDSRKYFSPLNLSDIKSSRESEKEKELNLKLSNINKEIDNLENRMSEIMDFLRDIDEMFRKKDVIQSGDNMIDNLNLLAEYYSQMNPPVEILFECSNDLIKIDEEEGKSIVSQVADEIDRGIKKYNISVVLLELEKISSGKTSDKSSRERAAKTSETSSSPDKATERTSDKISETSSSPSPGKVSERRSDTTSETSSSPDKATERTSDKTSGTSSSPGKATEEPSDMTPGKTEELQSASGDYISITVSYDCEENQFFDSIKTSFQYKMKK